MWCTEYTYNLINHGNIMSAKHYHGVLYSTTIYYKLHYTMFDSF